LDTLQAKQDFDLYAGLHNVTIKRYHCENGLFAGDKFVKHVKNTG